jgi:S1-C subfamily serine protease
MRFAAFLLAAVCFTGSAHADVMLIPVQKTIPQLVKDTEDCIYRVEVRGTAVQTVTEDGIAKEVEGTFTSVGTGFTVPSAKVPGRFGNILRRPLLEPAPVGKFDFGVPRMQTIGYLVTNSHVVCPPGKRLKGIPTIKLDSRRATLYGTLVGHDPQSDLAVIEVQASNITLLLHFGGTPTGLSKRLPTLSFAAPGSLEVGEDLVAIGFAHDLDGQATVTRGILSAIDRNYAAGEFSGLVQTDASINHGNSGGPLLNLRGEVVGVNTYGFPDVLEMHFDAAALRKLLDEGKDGTFKLDDTVIVRKGAVLAIGQKLDVSKGVNFARSCATVKPFVEQLIDGGRVNRLDLGILPFSVDKRAAEDFQLQVGVLVGDLQAFSLAGAAGLQPGDVVRQIGPYTVRNIGDMNNALALLPREVPLKVAYIRPSEVVVKAIREGKAKLTDFGDILKAIREQKWQETTITPPR